MVNAPPIAIVNSPSEPDHGLAHLPFLIAAEKRDASAQTRPAFVLLLLATGALLLRPADLFPKLASWPIYEALMIACLAASLPAVLQRLRLRTLASSPISACVLALVPAVALSHLSRLSLEDATPGSAMMAKLGAYFLLVVSLVDSASRLRTLLGALVAFIAILTAFAVLQYHGLLNLPSLEVLQQVERDLQSDSVTVLLRLRSVGLFNDPNDLSLILVLGIALCGYGVEQADRRVTRAACLALLGLLIYAVALTHSRGGLLALVSGVAAFLIARLGWRNALLLSLVVMPLVWLAFPGRQTSVDFTSTGETFQTRLQLWSETLDYFRADPLLGIGEGKLVEAIGQVTHNSFLHAYAELGLLGGTLFLGAFYAAYRGVRRAALADQLQPTFATLHPYMLSIAAAYAAGLLTLSRVYTASTYLVLAVLAAYVSLASRTDGGAARLNAAFVRRLAAVSALFLLMTYLFVRLVVRWE